MKSLFFSIAWRLYFLFPPTVRQILKNLLKGGGGHEDSMFNKQIAIRDAKGKCNLEQASIIFAEYLEILDCKSIEGKVCLEIGAGYVSINSIIMWLLGAKRVHAMDLNNILVVEALDLACSKFDKSKVFETLVKFVDDSDKFRQKIDYLYDFKFKNFDDVNYFFSYIAPFNILSDVIDNKFDFVFSISVLEHIPPSIINDFMGSLIKIHSKNGESVHFIDLTDHYDHNENPFGFLSTKYEDYDEDKLADSRGNRIRAYEWQNILKNHPVKIIKSHLIKSDPSFLPKNLSSKYINLQKEELLNKSILIRFSKF